MGLGSGIMSRQLGNYGVNILKRHAEWLLANGYKQQAKSCKRQIRMILKKKFLKAPSFKLDMAVGYDRMNLESEKYI